MREFKVGDKERWPCGGIRRSGMVGAGCKITV